MDLYEIVVKDADGRILSSGLVSEREIQDRVASDVRHAVNLHRNAQGVVERKPRLVVTVEPTD